MKHLSTSFTGVFATLPNTLDKCLAARYPQAHEYILETVALTPSAAAPRDLELVRRFTNSVDLEGGRDDLSSTETFARWFAANIGPDTATPVRTDRDLHKLRAFRDVLRAVLLCHNDGRSESPCESTVSLRNVSLTATIGGAGEVELQTTGDTVDSFIARLLLIAQAAKAAGTWHRLKACAQTTCQWAFFDRSKNVSARWCSMSGCGNRTKTRKYRQRRKERSL
ncbi:MAG: CGNR zinc finger domain-containing protein [Vulcanimicrobiaceae bacterium]